MSRIVFLALMLHAALPAGLGAQEESGGCESEIECLAAFIGDVLTLGATVGTLLAELDSAAARGCPPGAFPSRCGKLLPIVEATLSYRTSGGGPAFAWYPTWEAGSLVRVSQRTALGATAFVNVDSEGNRLGMRARFRRWLNDELTVDVGPGIFFTASEEALHAPGFSGLLSFGTHDAGFVFQAERLLYQDLDDRPPVADWRIHFGLRSRGEAAVGLTMLELLIYGIAAFAGF